MSKEIERKQRQQKLRSARELNKKYKEYSKSLESVKKKNKGKIPELGTHDGNLYHRYTQAMKAIEDLAEKQGIKLKSVKKFN